MFVRWRSAGISARMVPRILSKEGRMRRTSGRRWAAGVIFLLAAASLASAQASLSLKETLRKNIEASGGRAKLAAVRNLSFRTGGQRNFASASGELKVLTGKDPVVTEAVLVERRPGPAELVRHDERGHGARRDGLPDHGQALRRASSRWPSSRASSCSPGSKSFGPEKFYHLTLEGSGRSGRRPLLPPGGRLPAQAPRLPGRDSGGRQVRGQLRFRALRGGRGRAGGCPRAGSSPRSARAGT